MFGSKKVRTNPDAAAVADLRTAALRAICRKEHADGPLKDINPHTLDVTAYSLASMLTFDAHGERVTESLGRLVHMIWAGKPERIESRRRWAAWELDRLGHTAAARLLSDLTPEEAHQYMGPGLIPLGKDER